MSTVEENKQTVRRFWDLVAQNKGEEAIKLMDDNITYWVNGGLPYPPKVNGAMQPDVVRHFFTVYVKEIIPSGLKMKIKRIYGEGNTVITESESSGIDKNGRAYGNEYCQVYDFVDGRIYAVREYLDSHRTHTHFAAIQKEYQGKTASGGNAPEVSSTDARS